MSTIDSEKVSELRAKILNMANKTLEAYELTQKEQFAKARAIIYDIDRFEIPTIRSGLLDFEFEQGRSEK